MGSWLKLSMKVGESTSCCGLAGLWGGSLLWPSGCERNELAVGGLEKGSSPGRALCVSLGRLSFDNVVVKGGSICPLLPFRDPLLEPPRAVVGLSALSPPRDAALSPGAMCPLLVDGLLIGCPG